MKKLFVIFLAVMMMTAALASVASAVPNSERIVKFEAQLPQVNNAYINYSSGMQQAAFGVGSGIYADQLAYIIYAFDIPANTVSASLTLTVAAQWKIEASNDKNTWTVVSVASEDQHHDCTIDVQEDMEVDLSEYVGGEKMYIRISDRDTDTGHGPFIYNFYNGETKYITFKTVGDYPETEAPVVKETESPFQDELTEPPKTTEAKTTEAKGTEAKGTEAPEKTDDKGCGSMISASAMAAAVLVAVPFIRRKKQ